MRASSSFVAGLTLFVVLCGCHHDLAQLRRGSGGTGALFSDAGLHGDAAADAASSQAGSGGLASCAPCSEPPTAAGSTIVGHACCTGAHGSVCGSAFDTGTRCFPRDVPGFADTLCPDVTRAGKTLAGCCRVDAQCGVTVDALGLGCVARADVPAILGGPLAARSCVPVCKSDADCQAFSDAYVCVENSKDQVRFCGLGCQRDKDCAGEAGTVCAIAANAAENRVDAYCRKPFGLGAQDDPCSKPEDCMHGTCAVDSSVTPARQFCTQLCGADLDCTGGHDFCRASSIPLPDGTGSQPFRICLNQ